MDKLQGYWEGVLDRILDQEEEAWLQRKVEGIFEREQKIHRVSFELRPYHRIAHGDTTYYLYMISFLLLIKDQRRFYLEEGIYHGDAYFEKDEMTVHTISTEKINAPSASRPSEFVEKGSEEGRAFTYNRREAVRYAETWWNSYNPAYRHFDVDCTNYVSQCLRAGGAPMWGAPNRGKGWWYSSGSWSYSWAVAHALRWYLSGSRQGLTAQEVTSASELSPGDVICYDFQGNGRFDHNTIVVKKNSEGMPLVNAHTSNSRHRYWDYVDSTAYTPNIRYKFFHIEG